jgi:hypothetical protein
VGSLKKHAYYHKYYYSQPLAILRCRCSGCRVTHAIIPSFSVPGTSIGTAEAEEYLRLREQGVGRGKASRVFSAEKAMSRNHPAVLDRAFRTAVDRAKALFSGRGDDRLQGIGWVEALTGQCRQPIASLNQYCLEQGINCIALTRFPIQLFPTARSGTAASHNTGAFRRWKVLVDSW